MRDLDTIDSELRPIAAVRRAVRDEDGLMPTTAPTGGLLDERLAHQRQGRETANATKSQNSDRGCSSGRSS